MSDVGFSGRVIFDLVWDEGFGRGCVQELGGSDRVLPRIPRDAVKKRNGNIALLRRLYQNHNVKRLRNFTAQDPAKE